MGTDPDTHMVKDSGSTNRGKENVEVLSLLLRVRTRRISEIPRPSTTWGKSSSLNHVCIGGVVEEDDTDRKYFALAYFNPLTSTPILSPVALAISFVIFA